MLLCIPYLEGNSLSTGLENTSTCRCEKEMEKFGCCGGRVENHQPKVYERDCEQGYRTVAVCGYL